MVGEGALTMSRRRAWAKPSRTARIRLHSQAVSKQMSRTTTAEASVDYRCFAPSRLGWSDPSPTHEDSAPSGGARRSEIAVTWSRRRTASRLLGRTGRSSGWSLRPSRVTPSRSPSWIRPPIAPARMWTPCGRASASGSSTRRGSAAGWTCGLRAGGRRGSTILLSTCGSTCVRCRWRSGSRMRT